MKHRIPSTNWLKTREEDVPEEIRKYGICMYKDEMDW